MLKHLKALCLPAFVAAASLFSLASCDKVIYDDEGDCSVSYKVKFRYDMNLKWADAFASEVSSVHLYAFDENGRLARVFTEKGSCLAGADYAMTLDLPAGNYHLVAWCGLDNDREEESFLLPPTVAGRTMIDQVSNREDLKCSANRSRVYAAEPADRRLDFLFHGAADISLPEMEEGEHVDTLRLTKNTNHIRIFLQQLSGEDLDAGKFAFSIEDDNGLLAHNNDPLPDEVLTYKPWQQLTTSAGVGKVDAANASIVYVNGAMADLTVSRLMESHRKDMKLTITNTEENKLVASVPIIDYALLGKDYYEAAYKHTMTDQEFLDREDEYVMTFFLDESGEWSSASILIHSWRVVLQNVDIH